MSCFISCVSTMAAAYFGGKCAGCSWKLTTSATLLVVGEAWENIKSELSEWTWRFNQQFGKFYLLDVMTWWVVSTHTKAARLRPLIFPDSNVETYSYKSQVFETCWSHVFKPKISCWNHWTHDLYHISTRDVGALLSAFAIATKHLWCTALDPALAPVQPQWN